MEWILAFDAGCRSCTEVIGTVRRVAGDELTVAGLGEERIRKLRHQAFGATPPFAPTLLAVGGDRVRAWTGPQLSVRLARLLGPRRSWQVVRSLNQSDALLHDRRSLLKAIPGVALGAFVVSGGLAAPAMAGTVSNDECRKAREWVAANRDRLPMHYDDVVAYSMVLRKEIFAASDVAVKRQLWQEHLRRFRAVHPGLSAQQAAVLDQAVATLNGIQYDQKPDEASRAALTRLRESAVQAFGGPDAYRLLAQLGPGIQPAQGSATADLSAGFVAAKKRDCNCNVIDDWCGSGCRAVGGDCADSRFGCGSGWLEECNGLC